MGQHGHAACGSDPGNGIRRLGQFTRHVGWAPLCQISVKGVFGGRDILLVHQEPRNMRSTDRIRAGQSPHFFVGHVQPQ